MDYSTFSLNSESKTPIFEQIASWIIKDIDSGLIVAGDKLPTERELSSRLGVSRGTIINAYKKLSNEKIIDIIHGSGSYVLKGKEILKNNKKKEAYSVMDAAVTKLENIGFSHKDILSIMNSIMHKKNPNKNLNIAIIENNHEVLLDIRDQLAYLKHSTFSIFILESITMNPTPERFLDNYDIIITSSVYYEKVVNFLPGLSGKIIEAAISPSKQTLIDISSIRRDTRIGIICRTNIFLKIIKSTLLSFDFKPENIFSIFEVDYTTSTYFPGGINVLISFNHAHIFTDSDFIPRNEKFINNGGKLIKFEYVIERGTLIYIEDKISLLFKDRL